MKKGKSVNKILAIFLFVLVLQTILLLLFGYQVMKIPDIINSTRDDLENQININNAETQNKINQITNNLLSLEENFDTEIKLLKAETSADFSGIIEDVIKSVVTIRTDVAQGTGFAISNDGYIITNAHVLSGATYANAVTSERASYPLALIGFDPTFDIALLKVNTNIEALSFADSNNIAVGEKVIAIGNPLGLSFSVSEGIVSAIDRPGSNNINAYIQTDAALNPGNSGGPLINKEGKVIGINNFKITGENLGFALESNFIKEAVNGIARNSLNQTIL